MYIFKVVPLLVLLIMLSACAEDSSPNIVDPDSPVAIGVTPPIITDDVAGDWELKFDTFTLQFRINANTERVIQFNSRGVGSSSARVAFNNNKMTLTMGYTDATILLTANVSRASSTSPVDISNIQVTLTFFGGTQSSHTGTITSATIGDIDYELEPFTNTFAVNYIPSIGGASLLADTTYTTNSDGTVSDNAGTLIAGSSFVSNGNLDWSLVIPAAPNSLNVTCEESIFFISFNCNYVLSNGIGTQLETGSAQFSPTGHTFASRVGNYAVNIPGQALAAQLIINNAGSATITGYGNYFTGTVATSSNGNTLLTFIEGDNELTLRWFVRPGIAPFQGSARISEKIAGQKKPLLAMVIEKL